MLIFDQQITDGLQTNLNNALHIYGSKKGMNIESIVYLFDSNSYSTLNGVGGYGWITSETIDWYKRQSLSFTINNNMQPIPSVAFFHIPLPEYGPVHNLH